MTGRLIAVVGPSGVGKDSVMAGMARARPGLHVARRVITREADAGGEVFTPVTLREFDAMREAGDLALFWQAHGLSYGVPASVCAALDDGQDVLVNLSRRSLGTAVARFPGLAVIALSASPATLARRLAGRGRESEADIAARLARSAPDPPRGVEVLRIINDGSLDATVAAALLALYPVRA